MGRRRAQAPGEGAGLEEDAAPPLRDGEEPLQLRGDAGAARPAAGARAFSATCSIQSPRPKRAPGADRRPPPPPYRSPYASHTVPTSARGPRSVSS